MVERLAYKAGQLHQTVVLDDSLEHTHQPPRVPRDGHQNASSDSQVLIPKLVGEESHQKGRELNDFDEGISAVSLVEENAEGGDLSLEWHGWGLYNESRVECIQLRPDQRCSMPFRLLGCIMPSGVSEN